MINILVFQLRHGATFSRRVLIAPMLALLLVTALVIAALVAGCSGKPEAQPAPPAEVQKPVQKPADVPKPLPKPATEPAKPVLPAEPAVKKPETLPAETQPEAKSPFDINGLVRETDSGRLHMRADVTSNLTAPVKVRVTFVLSKDEEGKEVIHQLPLTPMEMVLEPGKPTRVSILLEGMEPRGQYYCNVLVVPVK